MVPRSPSASVSGPASSPITGSVSSPVAPAAAPAAASLPPPSSDALRSTLHDRGQRLTPQRQRVLALFEQIGAGTHLSAEQVHQRLLAQAEKVSLATVYRTLRLLSSMGLLQELELPEGGRRYELASDSHRDHHHLVCVRCGRTEEFEDGAVLQAGDLACLQNGFHLLECVLTVRAVCPRCAQQD